MRTLKSKGGFTLVELIVVIAILAILAGVAIPVYNGYITKAQDAAAITELDAIATAAQAANATEGAISGITVAKLETAVNGKTHSISVSGATATNYDADFVLFFDGAVVNTDDTLGNFYASLDLDGTSYSGTATWDGAKWNGVKAAD